MTIDTVDTPDLDLDAICMHAWDNTLLILMTHAAHIPGLAQAGVGALSLDLCRLDPSAAWKIPLPR